MRSVNSTNSSVRVKKKNMHSIHSSNMIDMTKNNLMENDTIPIYKTYTGICPYFCFIVTS